ncbi:hypothetical protein [Pleurocapsa sp. PCC 7319]|uniref:hypothetical protein n=1 Tax=Pleurocapsa sp. PCC 7319 TaxID=118161 RepID=UPI00034C9DA6|nr:hypothetical protein [Pleurocapsa sp. PCC 7319]
MYESDDNFNLDHSQDPNSDKNLDNKNLDNIDANLSAKNIATRKKQIESIFIKLIALGLAIGAILGIGTYYLLNKLGLTKKPYQIEQEKQQPEKSLKEILVVPQIPKSLSDSVERI